MRHVASTFQHVKCKWMEAGDVSNVNRMRNRCGGLGDVWNAGTMSESDDVQGRVEKTARYVKSFISRNENNIKSGRAGGRRLPASRFRCRITVLPAVPDVISHLRFVPSRRDFLVYFSEILGRNLGKNRAPIAAVTPNLMKIKNYISTEIHPEIFRADDPASICPGRDPSPIKVTSWFWIKRFSPYCFIFFSFFLLFLKRILKRDWH